jgi:hypothetical protein
MKFGRQETAAVEIKPSRLGDVCKKQKITLGGGSKTQIHTEQNVSLKEHQYLTGVFIHTWCLH